MFSKSEVMKKAWQIYRHIHATYADWQLERGIHDGSFAGALKSAWRILKAAAADAAKKAREYNGPFSAAIANIRDAIDHLKYKSFRYDIRAERAAMEAQIADLIARGEALVAAGKA